MDTALVHRQRPNSVVWFLVVSDKVRSWKKDDKLLVRFRQIEQFEFLIPHLRKRRSPSHSKRIKHNEGRSMLAIVYSDGEKTAGDGASYPRVAGE